MPLRNNHTLDIQKYFLPSVLVLLIVTLMYFLSSFFVTLIIAGVIVTAVYPVHRLLNKKIRIPRTFSALLSLILVAVILVGPFLLFYFLIAEEAANAYIVISKKINELVDKDISFLPSLFQKGFLVEWMEKISEYAPISASDIIEAARDFVGKISSFLLGHTTNILKHLSVFVIHIIVFLLAVFYFFRDGDKLIDYVYSLIPLSEKYRQELFKKLSHLSYGLIYGIFGAAIMQGFLVGIGFYIAGISNAAFWGAIAALFSPVPYIGTSVIWIPAAITLLVTQHWIAGTFLVVWGAAVVGLSDNLVKPYLIGSAATLHPLAVLLVLLGGAFMFGLKGLIFGPFVLTLTLAFLHIYSLEYKNVLKAKKRRPHIKLKKPQ